MALKKDSEKKEDFEMMNPEWRRQLTAALLHAPTSPAATCTPAAVLVALISREGRVHVVFTRRTMKVATHKGQVSLPGGVRESSDNDDIATALREAEEEIGLSPANVRILGYLPGQKTVTDYWITPVVGEVLQPFSYQPAEFEVEQIFEVPLALLRNRENWRVERREVWGQSYLDYRFVAGDQVIWGATGKIVYALAAVLNDVLKKDD